ncbi:MAG: hypothetical protein QXN37_03240 [Candidatus Anstonellaceae archaeon]
MVSAYDSNFAGSSEVKILHGNATYVIVNMKKNPNRKTSQSQF